MRLNLEDSIESDSTITVLTFENPLDNSDKVFYSELNSESIKSMLIRHYLVWFCENSDKLPIITINKIINDILDSTSIIDSTSIQMPNKDINIYSKKDFKDNPPVLYQEEEILLDDIVENTNNCIISLHKEIKQKNDEKQANIDELQKMFLLNPKTLQQLRKNIPSEDSDESILKKVYEADVKIMAEKDAVLKKQLEYINQLSPHRSPL